MGCHRGTESTEVALADAAHCDGYSEKVTRALETQLQRALARSN